MEVVALVPSIEHVCTRYRVAQFARHLEAVGLQLRLEPLQNGWRRLRQVSKPRPNQVVLLIRKLLPVWQLLLLRQSSKVLVYDFDDAVYLRDSFHSWGPYSLTRSLRFWTTVQLADMVFAGNSYLADAAKRATTGHKIHIMPTCVDPHRYSPAKHAERMPTRLVWIGSSSTMRALESARQMLEAIGCRIPNVVLRVICNRFPRFEHLRVEPARWSSETEGRDLKDSDIGLSWIPDDQWSRGKCGLKVLQYMAAGLPVVASPVGVHSAMLDQHTGFLPRDREDWIDKVALLATNCRLRRQMGQEGRYRLERYFHIDTWGPILADHLVLAASWV